MNIKLSHIDVSRIAPKATKAKNAALGITAENVLADCKPYVPKDTGDLARSGKTLVQNGEGFVSWGGDEKTAKYARRQYYDTSLRHHDGQCAHWFDVTAATRKDAWHKMFSQEYKRRC